LKDSVYFLFRGRNVHVYRVAPERWVVVREHAEQASASHAMSREAAIDKARDTARREGVDLVIHKPTGEVESREEFR